MDKQKFLDHLENGQIAAVQNKAELSMLPETVFEPFDDNLPIVEYQFNEEYFYNQISRLRRVNFSKKRCEHLIQVKEKMQEMGAVGFVISEQNKRAMEKAMQFNQEVEERLAHYRPDDDFQAAIQARNINRIRTLIESALNNRLLDSEDVSDMVWYIQRNFPEALDIYEEDTKFREPFNENQSKWNYDYFIEQQSPLNMNFALERVLHLIIVRDFLRKQDVPEFQKLVSSSMSAEPEEKTTSSEKYTQKTESKQPKNSEKTHSDRSHSPLKAALIVGGGILALVALAIAILK